MLDDLEDMFQLKANDKGLQLIFDRHPDLPRYVRTDEVKLRQVLINLLNNAIKFTEDGGVSLRVGVQNCGVAKTGEGSFQLSLTFEIEDTGVGIATDELDTIFEAFTQTTTGKKSKEGTGLGLAIARSFVQLMGGKITVSSQVEQGSIFKFVIPVNLVDSADMEIKQLMRRVIALEPKQSRYRILIVDDKWDNRQLLIKLLFPLGFEVKEASNGQDALEIWQYWQPHLIWMDIRMPVMDGMEATREIRARENYQSKIQNTPTVIIAITASTFEEEKAVVLAAGCDDFVRKPFREQIIFEKIAEFLGVRYIYEQEEPQPGEAISETSLGKALREMSSLWIQDLYQAAESIDNQQLFQLISQIPPSHASLAQVLADWVNQFRCDRIIDLIKLIPQS
jgi:CheY-like chemotaxis protein